MKTFEIDRRQRIAKPLEEVFAFFSEPSNLERLTPPWLNFHIVGMSTPTIGEGTLIDYRLKLRGVPLRWRSRIVHWNPPYGFVDEQLRGPYRSWVHRHGFEREGAHTIVSDNVRYAVLGGALINRLLVRPDVERIFDYRAKSLPTLFGLEPIASSP